MREPMGPLILSYRGSYKGVWEINPKYKYQLCFFLFLIHFFPLIMVNFNNLEIVFEKEENIPILKFIICNYNSEAIDKIIY